MPKNEQSAPALLNDQVIDLQLDYKERGGVQRFKTVGDFQKWLMLEQDFWSWLRQNPANAPFGRTNLNGSFFQYHEQCNSHLNRAQNEWKTPSEQLHRLESLPKQEVADNHTEEIKGYQGQSDKILESLKNNLSTTMQRDVISSRNHICSHEPEANFVFELAETDAVAAVFALEYFIKESGNAEEVLRPKGHFLAGLFQRGFDSAPTNHQVAFQKMAETWSRELVDYQGRYEALKSDYESLKNNNRQAGKRWVEKTADMAAQFTKQLDENEQELSNLKETYEAHMVLEAPVRYWTTKRRQHAILIKRLRGWLVKSSIVGTIAIGIAAYFLLPEFYPSSQIPWRNLGLFLLLSTFILWGVRLCVKLLLSNIHLEADAREREVMIQTFMAMMRHKESREGVKKQDIALVLAPIFKPSTSGVIKDDASPLTLTDFITRMSGK
jgi:hypothetical protein